jgi:NAD(P)-dependent dehydrogenase (short-subunit alcohol dehydrogenase family)/acyl carrier protein
VLNRLCGTLLGTHGEDQLAIRARSLYARRMVRARRSGDDEPGLGWQPRGTILVTGGTGALGTHLSRLLAGSGADHLLLISRRGRDAAGAADLQRELEERGCRVTIAACDITDHGALSRVLGSIPAEFPLRAVFHAAGASQPMAKLHELTLAEAAEVGKAKILGARHLDELLNDQPLDAFVLFSSGSAVWGSAGQSVYGSANAFLDGLARQRRDCGRTATSIAWGSWDAGMVDKELSVALRRIGAPAMAPSAAISALRQQLQAGGDDEHVVIADIDWPKFVPVYTLARPRPLINALPEVRDLLAGEQPNDHKGDAGLVARLTGLPAAEQSAIVLDLVRTHVAQLLEYDDEASLDVDRPFQALGFDSVTAVELRTRLNAATGKDLSATLIFDHPTPIALAEYLLSQLCEGSDGRLDVQAEVDRLRQALTVMPPEEIDGQQIIPQLEGLIARLREALGVSPGITGLSETLDTASADQIFDFIDGKLGLA